MAQQDNLNKLNNTDMARTHTILITLFAGLKSLNRKEKRNKKAMMEIVNVSSSCLYYCVQFSTHIFNNLESHEFITVFLYIKCNPFLQIKSLLI